MAKKKAKNSSKTPLIILAVIIVLLLGAFLMNKPSTEPQTTQTVSTSFDFGNQKILLHDQELTFVNGSYISSDATYGQHTASITNQSVNPAGTRAAAIVIDNPGGSGTFYYLVGSMLKDGKETYSQPVLLGDRIKIVSVSVDDPGAEDNGVITVEYLDRPANAAMATEPTVQTTAKYAFQDDGNLITVLH